LQIWSTYHLRQALKVLISIRYKAFHILPQI